MNFDLGQTAFNQIAAYKHESCNHVFKQSLELGSVMQHTCKQYSIL